jgi:hypothetical protein
VVRADSSAFGNPESVFRPIPDAFWAKSGAPWDTRPAPLTNEPHQSAVNRDRPRVGIRRQNTGIEKECPGRV